MGGGLEILPMALSMGSKLFGGGSAQAAPAAQQAMSPFSAGLMGQPPAGGAPKPPVGPAMPPVPERNPMFSDPAGDARGAQMIKDNPMLQGAFAQAMSTPRGQPPITPVAPIPAQQSGDSGGSFAAKPWKNETVFGDDVTGQNWKPSRGQITLPEQKQPVPAATMSAVPAPERNENFHPAPPPAAPFAEQQFDTAAPGPAGMGVWDTIKGGLKTAQGKLKGLPTNPMGQVGLSLLASGYDGSNPYKLIQSSLGGIQPHELALRSADIAQATANRTEKTSKADDEAAAQMRALLAQMMMSQGGAQPGQAPASRQAEGQARVIR